MIYSIPNDSCFVSMCHFSWNARKKQQHILQSNDSQMMITDFRIFHSYFAIFCEKLLLMCVYVDVDATHNGIEIPRKKKHTCLQCECEFMCAICRFCVLDIILSAEFMQINKSSQCTTTKRSNGIPCWAGSFAIVSFDMLYCQANLNSLKKFIK